MAWRVAVEQRRADRADPQPPEPARARGHRRQRRGRAGRLRAARRRRRPRASCSSAPAARSRCAVDAADLLAGRGHRARGSCRCRAGSCSTSRTTTTATRVLPAGVPTLSVEAGVTFGWERWADDSRRHRPLRRLRARATVVLEKLGINPRRTSAEPRPRRCSASAIASTRPIVAPPERTTPMTPTPATSTTEQGQSPWLDNLKRGWITSGELRALGRARRAGHHVEPVDLPEGDRGERRLRRRSSRELVGGGDLGRRQLLGARHRRHPRRARASCARSTTRATASTASCRSRSPRRWPATPTAPSTPARHLHDLDRRAQPLREDPRHRRGPAGHPADDQRGPQHQRHAAVLPRALRRGDRGLPLRARGRRGRPVRRSRRWRRSSSAGSTPRSTVASTRSAPTRRSALRGKAAVANAQLAYELFLERFAGPRWEALAARGARVQRPLWASTSTKNPAYPDTLYVDDADRARHGQHHARRHARRVRRPRHAWPAPSTPTSPAPTAVLDELADGRRRPRRRHPRRSRTRASPRSASRSTSCSASLETKADELGTLTPATGHGLSEHADERVAHRRRRRARRVRRAGHRGVPRPARRRASRSRCRVATPPGPATSGWPPTPAPRSTGGRSTSTGATSAACPSTTRTRTTAWPARRCSIGSARPTPPIPMRCDEGADPYQLRVGELGPLRPGPPRPRPRRPHRVAVPRARAALDADPGRLVVMNEDPLGAQPASAA